jgi:DNA-binding response OmpR family regulator
MNLLWVENHQQFAQIAARQFLGGHTVTVVASLATARAALAGGSFGAVLIDFDLDDGKGEELVRELRSSPGRPWLVAASSHEAGNRALAEAGADAVCGKLEFARIDEVLGQLAERKQTEVYDAGAGL